MEIRTNNKKTFDFIKGLVSGLGYTPVDSQKQLTFKVENVGESKLRIELQDALDKSGFKFGTDWVLLGGNSIWPFKKITQELERIKKSRSTSKITKYFYEFMHLNFTIAHYNIDGWRANHSTWESVYEILRDANPPSWKTDVKRIVEYASEM